LNALLNDLGLDDLLTTAQLMVLIRVFLVIAIGFLIAKLVSSAAGKAVGTRLGRQESMIARRFTFYLVLGLPIAMALHLMGFKLSVLLGAAGLLTVAVGFASQTSASNLISGLFLIAERSFVVGNVITVEGITGEVLSIDLLSVKLRTFDNLYVRVPNESIIKARITNLTHFPLRRVDVKVGVAYRENLERVRDILFEVADRNPLCLDEPNPVFIFKEFGDSALEMQFGVWGLRENYLTLRNDIHMEIKAAFDAAGVEIPFPHRTLYTGSQTAPFPVRVVDEEPAPDSPAGSDA
jgi:small-conductance mechanosensitive channel